MTRRSHKANAMLYNISYVLYGDNDYGDDDVYICNVFIVHNTYFSRCWLDARLAMFTVM